MFQRLKRWVAVPAAAMLVVLALGACEEVDPGELEDLETPIEDTTTLP